MEDYEEIRQISERLVKAFEIPEGPFYLQILKGKDGIRVNELACRIGGAFEDVMIPHLTGFDFLGAVMNGALGHAVDAGEYLKLRCDRLAGTASVQLLFCRPGKIAFITPEEELRKLPFVLSCGYNYREGSVIGQMENATARFGHAVITGTKDTMAQNLNLFYETLSVRSETGEELLQRFYPEQ